jgi:hypothetical protein
MSARRERVLFVALAAALVGAAGLAYWLMLARGPAGVASAPAPPPPPAEPPPSAQAVELVVRRADGTAVLLRPGAPRQPLAEGLRLQAEDVIETAEGAEVELSAGESYEVLLEGASRFRVREIAAEISRFRIDDGLVTASVRDDPGRNLVVEAAGGEASTRGGRMAVAAAGGRVTVGVSRGQADLAAGGQVVTLRAGQSATAADGRPPGPPVELPRSLLLEVGWPEVRETNRPKLVVKGTTSPGAILTLGGQRVQVGADGRFTHTVLLREGSQQIEAVARDVGGRRERSRSPAVVLDTRLPDTRIDTRGLWKGR